MKEKTFDNSIDDIIVTYNHIVRVVDTDAHDAENAQQRSYGGMIRSVKGKLQEYITESLVRISWKALGQKDARLDINKSKVRIPMKKAYLDKIENKTVKQYISDTIEDYYYRLSVDKHVCIDDKFVMGIECKAYTENAMIKRILVDFDLLLTVHPDISCYVFQLESQLTGDYSQLNDITYGSCSTHTIQSYFNNNLRIITLLQGERNIQEPVHKYFKELKRTSLERAIHTLKEDLRQYI